ncbi:hypothetical protein [Nocardioides daeguensis]|uniref:Uncharacterized protein n=1 Tax=Nocardioides daeguensis TaxID=908359 RepID=A0ABP6VP69_9ACTN|nr:hypothetical protein [Nocardioides daeguensis]MBV6727351.1 hypothetical protein [Nocardioides daeguensis]MCR1775440.1 hypothetical protein [Nocardioides daeguensis]
MSIHLTKAEVMALAGMWVAILVTATAVIDTPPVRAWMFVIAALVTATAVGRGGDASRKRR